MKKRVDEVGSFFIYTFRVPYQYRVWRQCLRSMIKVIVHDHASSALIFFGAHSQAEKFLTCGKTVRFSTSAHGQAIRKLCNQIGGQALLKPILYPDIMPDIMIPIVREESRAETQNCFLLIVILLLIFVIRSINLFINR